MYSSRLIVHFLFRSIEIIENFRHPPLFIPDGVTDDFRGMGGKN
jgi:hypothetical protein